MTTHAPKYAMHRFLLCRSRVRGSFPHRLVRQTRLAAWGLILVGLGDAAVLWQESRHLGQAHPLPARRAAAAPGATGPVLAAEPAWKGLELTQHGRRDGRNWAGSPAVGPR